MLGALGRKWRLWFFTLAIAGAGVAMSSGALARESAKARGPSSGTTRSQRATPSTATPIKHVVVIIGENHTFDNVFGTYQPPKGQTVRNLLSEGIINADGSPGPNFARAHQFKIISPPNGAGNFFMSADMASKMLYTFLPTPDVNGVQKPPAAGLLLLTPPGDPGRPRLPDRRVRPARHGRRDQGQRQRHDGTRRRFRRASRGDRAAGPAAAADHRHSGAVVIPAAQRRDDQIDAGGSCK